MSKLLRQKSRSNIIYWLFALLLVLGGIVTYRAAKQENLDLRSLAYQAQRVIKSWEFNGSSFEGWKLINVVNGSVAQGYLKAIVASSSNPQFVNTSVDATMPKGLKAIQLRLSVSPQGGVGYPSTAVGSDVQGEFTPAGWRGPIDQPRTDNQGGYDDSPSSSQPCRPCEFNPKICALISRIPGFCPMAQNPTPTCVPKPSCRDNPPYCYMVTPLGGWCPETSPRTSSNCVPLPSCLLEEPVLCEVALLPNVNYCPRPGGSRPFTLLVRYTFSRYATDTQTGADSSQKTLFIQGVADGAMRTYTQRLNDIGTTHIETLEIMFTDVPIQSTATIDFIRLASPGRRGRGDEAPPGCYYQQVQCFTEPCEPVLICPSTSPNSEEQ